MLSSGMFATMLQCPSHHCTFILVLVDHAVGNHFILED